MKTVIILPAYNERGNIERLIAALEEKVFPSVKGYQMSILVVDDNSPDGTGRVVSELMKKWRNIHLLSGNKEGLGAAYIRGMNYAVNELKAELLFEMDADLSHQPEKIADFLSEIDKGADMAVGARYIKGGSIPENWPFSRKLFSVIGNLFIRWGLGVLRLHDWSSGYRAIKKWVFQTAEKKLQGFDGYVFQAAFLNIANESGAKIVEVPINFTDRTLGKSKFPAFEYITDVIIYVVKSRIKKEIKGSFLKFCLTGLFGFILQTIIAKELIFLNLTPALAVSAGAEGAIISNFILNNFWTFSHKKHTKFLKLLEKLVHFNAVSLGAVAIQGVSVGLGTIIFGHSSWFIIMVLSIIFLVIPYSYFIYNKVIWRNK